MPRIEVAVAAPLSHTLSYSWDPETDGDPVGRRVLVPMGRQRLTGYVLGLLPEEDVSYRIRPVLRFLDAVPLFPENMIPFFRWIADYYHYPIGEVIRAALPGGLTQRNRKVLSLTEEGREALKEWPENDTSEPAWFARLLHDENLSATMSKKVASDREWSRPIGKWEKSGLVAWEDILDRGTTAEKQELCYRVQREIALPESIEGEEGRKSLREAAGQLVDGRSLTVPLVRTMFLLSRLAREQGQETVAARDLRKRYSGASKALGELEERGLVCSQQRRVYRNPFGEPLTHFPRPRNLTGEQEQVLAELLPALGHQEFATFLLHGVTGCGKTEVYLRAAEATLALGRDVLILVPEIALATQLEAHFVSRFAERVVLLHSGLTPGERFDQWSLAAGGRGRVVIGARSAVFAPLRDPGLIVVDEEHDSAYKQEDGLRYQGRDLAILRGRFHKSVVLLGSGTPSISSYSSARKGKFSLLTMAKRVEERPLPTVSIIDLRQEKEKRRGEAIGLRLHRELEANLERGEQSILLLNRRGFSSIYLCRDCGEPVSCSHCHVSLTYHKQKAQLICHYCGYSLRDNVVCTHCQSHNLMPVGFGTERIEQEICDHYPEARVARIDSDSAADRRSFMALLRKMHNREIDILIGTQMIAKGHDFPHVTLVGVVWADGGLSMPDYRAAERTYQLLSQVTGRAGRGEVKGRVVVQTLRPEHYAIQLAAAHDYESLFAREMEIRKEPMFPPYLRMVNVRVSGTDAALVQNVTSRVAEMCRTVAGREVSVLGPAPSPLERIRKRYRWQVLLKGTDPVPLHRVCSTLLDKQASLVKGDIRLKVDVDPDSMM